MEHIVIPLDGSHAGALNDLANGAAAAVCLDPAGHTPAPHVTIVAYEGLPTKAAGLVVTEVAATCEPFVVHAHGYGFFAGDSESGLSLHVGVVRTADLDELHRRVSRALHRAGAEIAPWCESWAWSPHITLLDRGLDPSSLGRAVTWLARRHHPSWELRVDRLTITGGWDQRALPGIDFPLGRR